MNILGDRIKKEREKLGLTREEFANKIGVSYSAIAMYERGEREPNSTILIKICNLFNCSIDYILGISYFKTAKENTEHVTTSMHTIQERDKPNNKQLFPLLRYC